jgi:hypothetical protein
MRVWDGGADPTGKRPVLAGLYSFEQHRRNVHWLESVAMAVFALGTLVYVADVVALVVLAVGTADPALRCFAEPSPLAATVKRATTLTAINAIGAAMVLATWHWVLVIRRPWSALARYVYFSIVFNHRSFTLISVGSFAISFFSSFPVGFVIPTVVLVPVLDAVAHPTRADGLLRAGRIGVRTIMLRAITSYAFEVVVRGNQCTDERMSMVDYALFTVAATLNAAWNIALLAILSRKLRDFHRPFFDFRLRAGVGFGMDAFFAGTGGARLAQPAGCSEHSGRSIELSTKPGTAI